MNKDLKNDFYKIPPELLSLLNDNLKHSDKSMSGYKRLKSLCDEKGVGYQQAKKIKHEMENGMNPEVYKLIGGDELLEWISGKLDERRRSVYQTKKSKMNAGMENQFKKEHTKDKSKNPTKVRVAKVQKNSDEIINNRGVYENISRINEIIKKVI